MLSKIRIFLNLFFAVFLTACASVSTKTATLSPEELRATENAAASYVYALYAGSVEEALKSTTVLEKSPPEEAQFIRENLQKIISINTANTQEKGGVKAVRVKTGKTSQIKNGNTVLIPLEVEFNNGVVEDFAKGGQLEMVKENEEWKIPLADKMAELRREITRKEVDRNEVGASLRNIELFFGWAIAGSMLFMIYTLPFILPFTLLF